MPLGTFTREPGDLPSGEGISPVPREGFPVASTEVVMATSTVSTASLSLSDRLTAGLIALFLGGLLVFGAGLANSATIHDTAHDARHANGFPCH